MVFCLVSLPLLSQSPIPSFLSFLAVLPAAFGLLTSHICRCDWCINLLLTEIVTDAWRKSPWGRGWCHQGVRPPVSHTTACRVLAGIELITAFYGCLYAGCIPVTVRPPHAQSLTATLPTVRMIVEVSNGASAASVAGALWFRLLGLQWLTQLSQFPCWLCDSTDRSASYNRTVVLFIKRETEPPFLTQQGLLENRWFPRDTNVLLPPKISHCYCWASANPAISYFPSPVTRKGPWGRKVDGDSIMFSPALKVLA